MADDMTLKLQRMKRKVDEAVQEEARLQGRQQGLYERLKKEFKMETLPAARKELNKRDTDLDRMEKELVVETQELEQAYNWGL